MAETVLLLGGGGREHAIAWKLAQSYVVKSVLVAPGNAGTAKEGKVQNVSLQVGNHDSLGKWCKETNVDLVVIGPEAPLADGLVDSLSKEGISCFGPTRLAARIESDKSFAKAFMDRHGIATAQWKSYTNCQDAIEHVKSAPYNALVVKACGLAAGKGVVVAETKNEAIDAIKSMIDERKFGDAGATIVIEEKLCGEEISVLGFSDGNTIVAFPPAQDYKRLLDNNKGPNTGGMGAYSPVQHVHPSILKSIQNDILQRAVHGMNSEGYPFIGILYAGIMLTKDGPKVLEFNCRFGDPETEVLLPLLDCDLYKTMTACARGNLSSCLPSFNGDVAAVTVIVASGGYPGSYKKGCEISGLDTLMGEPNLKVFQAGTTYDACGKVVTSGGRVLAVTGIGSTTEEARATSYAAVAKLHFDDMVYRRDIATRLTGFHRSFSYLSSGVDIAGGMALVEAIKPLAKATARKGCEPDLGGFGGMFDLAACRFQDPILVSGTDGVGTKLKVAQSCNMHSSIGIDLVAMCVNDILASGAEPLFFLDYFACGKLDDVVAKQVITGIAQGCAVASCALIGGETAEMPGIYADGVYDLAGFAVGAVERNRVLPGNERCKPGDAVLGLASSGIHSNGFSLVRKIIDEFGINYHDQCPFKTDSSRSLAEELLLPTKIYVKSVLGLMKDSKVKAFAHITGGGLIDNIPRILPENTGVVMNAQSWDIQPVFAWLQQLGNITEDEMLKTFNCGIGAVLIVDSSLVGEITNILQQNGEKVWKVGDVVNLDSSRPPVVVENLNVALQEAGHCIFSTISLGRQAKRLKLFSNGDRPRLKVGVLISGSGTNLQALIDRSIKDNSNADIVLVISNVDGVKGLDRAQKAEIPTKVINHKSFKSRLEFDMAVDAALRQHDVELVCLAGFMRILTGDFVRQWRGKLINIHPSLLPSFKGMHAHRQVLEAGVRVSGCTVHFVEEEVDAGGIIVQETVPVYPADTEEELQNRVKEAEHKAYPIAMELIASGRVVMAENGKVQWRENEEESTK